MSQVPPGLCGCKTTVSDWFADRGIDAEVSVFAPILPTPYDPLSMRCPHGTVWFAQPTPEQVQAWSEVGVE